ncbi:hypothetical protein C0995_002958, partial [Termitomyces sp. Mi166
MTVSQPPVRLKMEDTGEAHLRALRERFEPASQACQKHVDIGKKKSQRLSEDDFSRLRQAWQQEFANIVNGIKEELFPWREVNHEINLIDEGKQYKYHLPRCLYLNAKWWEPWAATQAAPLLCIPKKDGALQTALDVRQRNDNTIKDVTPLLDQEAIRKDVVKARYRSKIDLTNAYEQ